MYFAQQVGVPFILAIGIGLVAAALVGLINGVFTVMFPDTIFHHHTWNTVFDQWLHSDRLRRISGAAESGAYAPGNFQLHPISQILWAIVVTLVLQFVLVKTRWGLHTIATGGNPLGAAEVGIRIGRIKMGNFIIRSVLGGLAGILEHISIGLIDPLAGGTEIMFMAIASSVIGGTLLTGGSGTIIGAFLGAAVLGILKDGFTLSGVSAYTFNMILGGAILITMLINVHLSRLRAAGGA